MRDRPIHKAIAAATVAGLAVIFTMQAYGFGAPSVGVAGFSAAIAVFFASSFIFGV